MYGAGSTGCALPSVSDVFVWLSGSESGEREHWLTQMGADFTQMSRLYSFEMHSESPTVFETVEVVWPPDIARRIRLVTPHLDRGIALLQRLETQRGITEGMGAILGQIQTAVLTLGPTLLVGYTNPAAEAVLRRGGGLRVRNGQLTARWRVDEGRLASAVSDACRGVGGLDQSTGAVRLPRTTGALVSVRLDESLPPYRVTVLPLRRQHRISGLPIDAEAMIFVDDPVDDVASAPADLWSEHSN